jgi:hypothetical protein
VRLVQVFKDFEVVVQGSGQFGKYKQEFRIEPKEDAEPLTEERLGEHVKSLQERFPERGFSLDRSQEFLVFSQPSRDEEGRRVSDRLSIYFRLSDQTVWVPSSFTKRKRKLMNYLLMRTLGSLGLTRSRYAGSGRRGCAKR